jgi:hypothetical protein
MGRNHEPHIGGSRNGRYATDPHHSFRLGRALAMLGIALALVKGSSPLGGASLANTGPDHRWDDRQYACLITMRQGSYSKLAEGEGFEPPKACTLVVFKTTAIDHSAIPPATSK